MKAHLKGMAIAGGLVLAVLLVAGVRPGAALSWAATLACPLMMVAMMLAMRRGHDHSPAPRDPGAPAAPEQPAAVHDAS